MQREHEQGIAEPYSEADALEGVFGNAPGPMVTSVKGALGESYSSGGVRAAALALSLRNGALPPTLGLCNPISGLNFVCGDTREAELRYGILNGIASGGAQVSLLFRKMDGSETS